MSETKPQYRAAAALSWIGMTLYQYEDNTGQVIGMKSHRTWLENPTVCSAGPHDEVSIGKTDLVSG
jgi:hypothetical protein